jgi:hypothetical protein
VGVGVNFLEASNHQIQEPHKGRPSLTPPLSCQQQQVPGRRVHLFYQNGQQLLT